MPKIWITSDTHFNSAGGVLKYLRKEFQTTEEMNTALIEEWNTVVAPQDTVYHLGDFAEGEEYSEIERIIKQLHGKIIFTPGNHDYGEKIKLYARYFEVEGRIQDEEIIMTHYPIFTALLEETSLRSSGYNERINIHGHMHAWAIQDKRYFNVNYDFTHKIFDYEQLRTELRQLNK